MSVRFDARSLEYTMVRKVGAGGMAEACQRPDHVRAIATRLMGWTAAPETCQSCHSLPAFHLRGGVPICSRCRENRLIATGQFTREGARPTVLRADDNTSTQKQLRGLAIVFNKASLDMGFVEYIRPVAADRLIAERSDLRGLWNHDSSLTLARYSAGTLRYEKTTHGVAVEYDPPSWARGHVESVDRRDITGQSFGFFTLTDDWWLQDGIPHREILDMEVIEVSVVSFPAYPDTTIRVVNADARSVWEVERHTRERLRLAR